MTEKDLTQEITLISQGRISKKDAFLEQYYNTQGEKLETREQPSTGYYKVIGMKKGETVHRKRFKTAWKMNAVVDGTRKERRYIITYTIYLYSEVDTKAEALRLLKKVWSEKTDFIPYTDFSRELDVPAEDVEEDHFSIKTKYEEGAIRNYEDLYETKVSKTRLTLTNIKKEFDESSQTKGSAVKKIGGKKYGWLKLEK